MSPAGAVTVRHARVGDAPALGLLHVRAWQAAYRGLMPDDYLDGLRPEERQAGWERGLGRDRSRDPVLVAERDGRVMGFAVLRAAEDPEGAGELSAINVDPDHWGTGAGWVADGAERTDEVFGMAVAEVRYRRRLERPPGDPAPGRG